MKPITAFPKNLKSIRKKRGLSVRKAARLLDVAPSTLQRYEAGENPPSLEKAARIASALGVNLRDLVGPDCAA